MGHLENVNEILGSVCTILPLSPTVTEVSSSSGVGGAPMAAMSIAGLSDPSIKR